MASDLEELDGAEFGEAAEEEEEPLRPRPLLLHDALVVQASGEVEFNYPTLVFVPSSASLQPQPIILIGQFESKFLIAVPSHVWSRTTKDRLLPSAALSKVFAAEVLACSTSDRSSPTDGVYIKVWFGLLKPEFEECLQSDESLEPSQFFLTVQSEDGFLPYAQSLISVADDKFAFMSAESSVPQSRVRPEGSASMETRMTQLEASVQDIAKSLKEMIRESTSAAVPVPSPKASETPVAPSPKRPSALRPPKYAGLDPGVVSAALQAGIDAQQLAELSRMIGSKKSGLKDSPSSKTQGPRVTFDILGEPVEPDATGLGLAEPVSEPESKDPVSAALVKLTSIVDSLASRKKSGSLQDYSDEFGTLLDSSTSSSSSGGRKHAALLAALRRAVQESPEEIANIIEQRMERDCGSPEVAPGTSGLTTTFRAWAEHRSRVPNLGTNVRVLWSICGALDCLRQGKTSEARCRLCLLVAQLDQLAIDRGQWVLAAEGGLEDAPPFSNFGRHTLPDILEPQHTRLWPTPWAEALMWTIKEKDEFLERKTKLNRKTSGKPQEEESSGQKGKKGNQKGGKGKGKAASQSTSNQAEEKTAN